MLQKQIALNHILSVPLVGPSSTGRVAFTESSHIVFHSLVSSSFVHLCSYSAKSNAISSSKAFGACEQEQEHGFKVLVLASLTDRTGPHRSRLFLI